MPVRVAIVDDHEVVRVGLASLLGDVDDIRVVALAADGAGAMALVRDHRPDVLVLDVRLPDGSGIDLVARVKEASPATRVLVLTSFGDDETVAQAVAAGVDAFASKTTDAESLLRTVRDLADGRDVLQAQVSRALIRYLQHPAEVEPERLRDRLTARESQIAAYVAEGLSNRQIGDHMGISEKTVKNHVSNILAKMNAHRRSEIIRYFLTLSHPRRSG